MIRQEGIVREAGCRIGMVDPHGPAGRDPARARVFQTRSVPAPSPLREGPPSLFDTGAPNTLPDCSCIVEKKVSVRGLAPIFHRLFLFFACPQQMISTGTRYAREKLRASLPQAPAIRARAAWHALPSTSKG